MGCTWTPLIIFLSFFINSRCDLALLRVGDTAYCLGYNPSWTKLPSSPYRTYPIAMVDPQLACSTILNLGAINGSIAMIDRGNCTFYQKVIFAQSANATAVIIINNSSELFPPNGEVSEYPQIHIPVTLIGYSDALSVLSVNDSRGTLYAPQYYAIDPNAIIIILIGICLISLGAHWAIYSPINVTSGHSSTEEQNASPFVFNIKTVFFYIIAASLLLVVLYFLYQYAVYVIMGVFVLGSTSGMYMCLISLLSYVKFTRNIPEGKSCNIPICGNCSVKSSILLFISFLLPILWIIFRHQNYIWILQDILGATMILGVLRTVHLPNFKIAVILLILFFLYDIFFVFITPLFTKDGKSIMVKVATGGDNQQEILPLTIMFPHLVDVFEGACGSIGYSILGFGDILMPGLVVTYCLAFDNLHKTWKKKIYFLVSIVAYTIGLVITYIALLLMETAQPALLYLVPSVIGAVALLGWYRGELKLLWNGITVEHIIDINEHKDDIQPEGNTGNDNQSEIVPLIEQENSVIELESVNNIDNDKNNKIN